MDLRQLDLNLLLTLEVLLEEGSVTGAAERLHLSQPAVSAQLRRLRELFQDPLLTPSGRSLVPTARAQALKKPLADALEGLARAVDVGSSFEAESTARIFRLAATDALHAAVTVPLLARMAILAPRARLAMYALEPERMRLGLLEGRLDLALLTPSVAPNGVDKELIYQERFVCVARPSHPLFSSGWDLDGFCAAEHVLVSLLGGGFFGAVDEALAAMGRKRLVKVSVPSFLLVAELLETSDLVATVPTRLAAHWVDRLRFAEPPLELPRFDVLMGSSPSAANDPGLRWLKTVIREQVRQPGRL